MSVRQQDHTIMRTTILLLALVAAAILSGCSTVSSHHDFTGIPAADFTVTVTCGEPSTRFSGTIVSDGKTEHLSGTGKSTFQVSGHEIVCAFKKVDAVGRIQMKITKAGGLVGEAITDEKFGGVRAELLYTPDQRHTVFTSF